MSHAIDPKRLVAALTGAGWVNDGGQPGGLVRLRWYDEAAVLIPTDTAAPDFPELMLAAKTRLDRLADAGSAAEVALTLATCPCEGRRWSEDENWQPDHHGIRGPILREPGNGLIPCGFCNEGGWNVEPMEVNA